MQSGLSIMGLSPFKSWFGVALVGVASTSAFAQWKVVNLHPITPVVPTNARALGGGILEPNNGWAVQSGWTEVAGARRACIWKLGNHPSGTWVDLHPGFDASEAIGTDGTSQVGYITTSGMARAALWNGTAGSWVDLHPAGATDSVANSVDGAQQVGTAWIAGAAHASLWTGTAGSWVDLNPAGATDSVVNAVRAGQQIGTAWIGGAPRASLWSGTAASWVDLHPPGWFWSEAYGLSGSVQVGYVNGGANHASLWSAPGSWVDLNPPGATESVAYAVDGSEQVGQAVIGGVPRAGIWSGTAGSWVDLHALLPNFPSTFASSEARAIWRKPAPNPAVFVAGWGRYNGLNRDEPLLWSSWGGSGWSVDRLYPATIQSFATDVENGKQVGGYAATTLFNRRASLWNGTAASWIDLTPGSATDAAAFGISGNQQVGYAKVGGFERPSLWSGTAGSWVDLTPAGQGHGMAVDIQGGQQVGWMFPVGGYRASLWTGSAATWVNLHPAAASQSRAFAIHGGQQVGDAIVGGQFHASLWTGSAASWVDLNPPGSTSSFGYCVKNGTQGGQSNGHAGTWTGTAATFVDLHPAAVGGNPSVVYGVDDGVQVGRAGIYASYWTGTAASWVNLNSLLPGYLQAAWGDGEARGVWNDGSLTNVVGHVYNRTNARLEALLWIHCQTPGDLNGDGQVNGRDIPYFTTCLIQGTGNCLCGDQNNDGLVTTADVPAYVALLTGP